MSPKETITSWFEEATQALIAKGATPADLKEEAFEELLASKVQERRQEEINANPELQRALIDAALFLAWAPG